MRRGAFTLLETMIVVLIVTAISAIFVPSFAARATAGRMGYAVRSIESAAALAASESMQRGQIVAFIAEQWDDEWVLWAERVEPDQIGELLTPQGESPPEAADAEQTWRAELASFDHVELTDVLPPAEDELLGPEPIDDAAADETDWGDAAFSWESERPRLVLGVFFPDGSCRAGSTMYLVGEDGARQTIRLRPLTGRVDARVLPRTSEEAERLQEAESEPMISPPGVSGMSESGGRP